MTGKSRELETFVSCGFGCFSKLQAERGCSALRKGRRGCLDI